MRVMVSDLIPTSRHIYPVSKYEQNKTHYVFSQYLCIIFQMAVNLL